jgi:hypothetical protein
VRWGCRVTALNALLWLVYASCIGRPSQQGHHLGCWLGHSAAQASSGSDTCLLATLYLDSRGAVPRRGPRQAAGACLNARPALQQLNVRGHPASTEHSGETLCHSVNLHDRAGLVEPSKHCSNGCCMCVLQDLKTAVGQQHVTSFPVGSTSVCVCSFTCGGIHGNQRNAARIPPHFEVLASLLLSLSVGLRLCTVYPNIDGVQKHRGG